VSVVRVNAETKTYTAGVHTLKNIIEETGNNALRESLNSPERSFAMVANSPERLFAKVAHSPERSLETGLELPTGIVREVRVLQC
jgi:hypothetical protein